MDFGWMFRALRRLQHDVAGSTAVEYAMIGVTTSLVVAGAMPEIQSNLSVIYSTVAGYF